MSTTCTFIFLFCLFSLQPSLLERGFVGGITTDSWLDDVCQSAHTLPDLSTVPTETNVSTSTSTQPPSYRRAPITRKGSALWVPDAAKSTFERRCASFTWLGSAHMGGSARKVLILDGLRTSQNLPSEWRRVQKSWNKRGLESVKKGKGRKRGSGKDVMGTEEKAEAEAEAGMGRGDAQASTDE